MFDHPPDPLSIELRRAAQYLRMSTDHQEYSIDNQVAAIALYAAAHNVGIVRSFVDEGKSGTSIKGRQALQELIESVTSGTADFDLILVYDVSRWGRFPDADEAAYYEFLCKRAGIQIRYCAEQFENDNSTTSNLLKALKRTIAGEYSRELSIKIAAGQHRLAAMGFWQGGRPPFGMLRQIVSQNGNQKRILRFGQAKSVSTDRVVLIPGPKKAVETIRLAFDLYTKQQKTREEIAAILNQRSVFWGNTPWNIVKLRCLFTNPFYKGAYPYCRTHLAKDMPEEKWLVHEHLFPAIISERQWNQARERIREEVKIPNDPEMLAGLRRLWQQKGTLNSNLINAAKEIPCADCYGRRFGGLNNAYRRIGCPVKRDLIYHKAISIRRKLRDTLYDQLCTGIMSVGGTADRTSIPGALFINGSITARITFSTPYARPGCDARWLLPLGKKPAADILIVARLEPPGDKILDYFVVPAFSELHGGLSARRNNNPSFLELYRLSSLRPLLEIFRRFPVQEVM